MLTFLLPSIRNLIRYLLRGDEDVDDVTQEALIALVQGLHTFSGSGAFVSWANRVVARVTFAFIKRRRSAVASSDAALDEVVPAPPSHGGDFLARRALVDLLDKIPEDQRVAFVMHDLLELTPLDIARDLGVPVETVRSRVRLAKERLRIRAAWLWRDTSS
ncbi:MAG: sigma-70 family RNA polymerase sigma factor [Myxococcales bacterium]|nr:sigma-70 family RNA polymerase sigma factor [Myxococcales bacterium]